MTDSTTLALESDFGHVRADLQRRFEDTAHCLRVSDGWINPSSGRRELRAALVLEGCGVRTPGLVGRQWLHERTAARTTFVDNACLAATDFDVPKERQYELFLNRIRAATEFIITSAAASGVPRN
jgi:hypothetical protein